ncbi:MAG: hypothetical protein U0746_03300 [Gemmataceae bacterium]
MKRAMLPLLVAVITWLGLSTDAFSQRGGGRGGGGRGGGGFGGRPGGGFQGVPGGAPRPVSPGGMPGGMPGGARPSIAPAAPRPAATPNRGVSPAAVGPHGAHPGQLPSGTGPRGGNIQTSGPKSGSITTKGGTTIDYKGAAAGGTTVGGVTGGKYVGGVQVTGPGGNTVNRVGSGGAVAGPGGNAAAGKSNITQASGPGGTATGASRSGVVAGPGGVAAGKSGIAVGPGGAAAGRAAAAVGPNGAVAGRAGAAVGPGGAVAGAGRVAATPYGTYYRSAAAISGQGVYVRQSFGYYHCFRPGWYARYPGAWAAAGFVVGAAWSTPSWGTVSSYCGYPAEPIYYDYGSTAVVEGDTMYVNGEAVGTAVQYAEQAEAIADAGQQAKPADDEKWQALGVFAMVQGDDITSYNLFQLAINKAGIIRGNYYNALTDSAEPVAGSVDAKSQRAAWTVGGRKAPVYEVGIANMTKDECTMLVHFNKDKVQQMTLVRVEAPTEEPAGPAK